MAIKIVEKTIDISIHAPLAGSDFHLTTSILKLLISIHAPLAGSDILTMHSLSR